MEVVSHCCSRTFRFASQLKRHLRIIHNGKRLGAPRKKPTKKGYVSRTTANGAAEQEAAVEVEDDGAEEEAPVEDGDEDEDEDDDDDGDYEVERIVAKVLKRGVPHYIVRYKGYGPEGDTTEPMANLEACMDLVNAFEQSQAEAEAVRKACLGLRG